MSSSRQREAIKEIAKKKKTWKKNLDKSASSNRATKPNVGIEANFRGFFIPVKWFVDLNLMKQVIFDLRMVNK